MQNSTEVQAALLAALEELQQQHSAQVKSLQSEQKQQFDYFSRLLGNLTERLDGLTEQLTNNATQTGSTAQQVQGLAKQLDGLTGLLDGLNSRLKP